MHTLHTRSPSPEMRGTTSLRSASGRFAGMITEPDRIAGVSHASASLVAKALRLRTCLDFGELVEASEHSDFDTDLHTDLFLE